VHDRAAEPVALEGEQRGGLRLAQQQPQLAPQPAARDGPDGRRGGERVGLRIGLEPEPGAVAGHAQQAGRVVIERALVEHAQHAGGEVLAGARPLGERAVGQPQRDRVDGEVAPREVLLDARARRDVGQRARPRVGLGARADHVERRGPRAHGGRAEAVVDDDVAAEPLRGAPGDRRRVALDHDVQLARHGAQQRVADGAADDVHARLGAERVQHGGRAGRAGHQLQQLHGAASSRVRVGRCRQSTT
jgi:hypothetical protein